MRFFESTAAAARLGIRWSIVATTLAVAGLVLAQSAARPPLNSERIESRFGSYGIEVIKSDANVRVSNLYSGTGASRTTRTFAVVRFPPRIDDAYAAEHREILAGGSIGAVFASHGWTVSKRNRYYGEVALTAKLATLMGGLEAGPLAIHIYVLDVGKNGQTFEYAWIAEVHHPDYLRLDDVRKIYGELPALGERESRRVGQMLELTLREMAD